MSDQNNVHIPKKTPKNEILGYWGTGVIVAHKRGLTGDTHLRNTIAEFNLVSNSFVLRNRRIPRVCHGPLIDAELIGKGSMLINTNGG
jgi:hypothetical protein